jgi:uncharacterized Ntn-hydrolase superfamily protein
MTFSLAARCSRTGQLGACVATSDIAVGARVPWAEAGVGAVLTQNRTDPRLGPAGLALLRAGADAAGAVRDLAGRAEHGRWRQLAVVDAGGGTAVFHGSLLGEDGVDARGPGCAAIGNMLARPTVCRAMADRFAATEHEPLAERLVGALEAGLGEGGEGRPLRSAALLVVAGERFPFVDLRVDRHPSPVAELRSLWDEYGPRADEFVARALDPDAVDEPVRSDR